MQPEVARSQYEEQAAIAAITSGTVEQLWQRMDEDFDTSWARISDPIQEVVDLGRRAAVNTALPYTDSVLAETGQRAAAVGELDPAVFVSTAPDGRDMGTLYDQAIVTAKARVGRGVPATEALAMSGRWLTSVTLTVLADTRREVYAADITRRPTVNGYVRMLNPPSCKDCIILSGRWYRWNTGFDRHPNCDCIHIPSSENVAGDFRTDPYEMFRSMSKAEQDATFGRDEARAIRDGADIYRVVNVGNRGLATARAAARYGTPSRATIEDIYRAAGTRTNAIRLMREHGYIRDRGQVAVALSPGVRTDAQILAAGRGRGTVNVGAGRIVTTGRARRFDAAQTGERNVLDRATMTAAERRLYDAHWRLQYARRTGNIPRGVGTSSADTYAQPIEATPAKIAELQRALDREIAALGSPRTPESVRRVARALGLL